MWWFNVFFSCRRYKKTLFEKETCIYVLYIWIITPELVWPVLDNKYSCFFVTLDFFCKTLGINMNRRNAKNLRPSHDWVNASTATHSGSVLYDMDFGIFLFHPEAKKMYGINKSCFMTYWRSFVFNFQAVLNSCLLDSYLLLHYKCPG